MFSDALRTGDNSDILCKLGLLRYILIGQEKGQNERIKREAADFQRLPFSLCDPLGARTQDPNIKSVVLYLLS